MLPGCASAVDDGSLSPTEEASASSSEELKGEAAAKADAALDADAADCDAAPATAGAQSAYEEYSAILQTSSLSADAAPAGNSCTAACRCCKWGNRFCCSHCNWCSGPIKASPGVLAP
jgi:hypothetical protein